MQPIVLIHHCPCLGYVICLANKWHTVLVSILSYGLRNYAQAIQFYDKALSVDPNNEVALYGKGEALNGIGNYTQAISYLDKALAIDPNNKVVLNDKGAALYELGNYPQAIQYYDKALAIDPKYKEALYNKQVILSQMGNVSSTNDGSK
jgi:tetratricopeptide (TPR) repeat protein